jgi:hypothetical protein
VSHKVLILIGLTLTLAACDNTPAPSNPTTSAINGFAGAWRSTASVGACTSMNWTVTPTGATTATIAYTASCVGVPVSGNANGTLVNGSTMSWTTTGTAGSCSFNMNGTAVPASSTTDLNVTYTGNVCGTNVNGSDTLHR